MLAPCGPATPTARCITVGSPLTLRLVPHNCRLWTTTSWPLPQRYLHLSWRTSKSSQRKTNRAAAGCLRRGCATVSCQLFSAIAIPWWIFHSECEMKCRIQEWYYCGRMLRIATSVLVPRHIELLLADEEARQQVKRGCRLIDWAHVARFAEASQRQAAKLAHEPHHSAPARPGYRRGCSPARFAGPHQMVQHPLSEAVGGLGRSGEVW